MPATASGDGWPSPTFASEQNPAYRSTRPSPERARWHVDADHEHTEWHSVDCTATCTATRTATCTGDVANRRRDTRNIAARRTEKRCVMHRDALCDGQRDVAKVRQQRVEPTCSDNCAKIFFRSACVFQRVFDGLHARCRTRKHLCHNGFRTSRRSSRVHASHRLHNTRRKLSGVAC